MKIFTTMRTLALAAGMLVAGTTAVDAKLVKPSGGSVTGNLVVSKVFYSGTIRLNGATPKNYMYHQYVELYNNSSDTLDITGVYVAFPNSDNGTAAWTAADMETAHKDSIVVKQIFQIPTDKTYSLDPGKSVVITNCAIDHSEIAEGEVDLSGADFEVKTTNKSYVDFHNEAVPAMTLTYTSSATLDFINILTTGPSAVILMAADTNIDNCPKTYANGKTTGNEYLIVPGFKTIDCVDIVKQKTPSADDKRIPTSYDAGFVVTDSTGTFSGQAVVRKTAFITSDGRTVLFDTNNSSVDFMATNDLSIRTYSEEVVGLSESTITIPESGYLAVNIEKPFCAGRDLLFVHVNASNNASTTDLGYYEFPGDSLLLIKGPWIAVGEPGSHTIKLSESQGVMRARTSMVTWADEDTKTVSQTNRMIYKFQNKKDSVGFKRVPAVEGKYNNATFTDADRLHIVVTEAIADKIASANGATDHADLDFIPWHGSTPDTVVQGVESISVRPAAADVIYDLQGRRVTGTPRHGLYILNGRKVVF